MLRESLLTLAAVWGWQPLDTGLTVSRWQQVHAATVPTAMADPDSVDRFVSRTVEYREDIIDEWASPGQTLARGFGDCEDLAILKRAMLIAGGVPRERILFVLAYDTIARRDHAFLLVYANGWHVLNGNGAQTVQALRDYRPILAMNARRTWVFGRVR